MHEENKYKSRTAFLKKLPLAIVSVFGLGFIGFNFQKLQRFLGNNFNTISDKEANDHISNITFTESKQIKPEPPPKFDQTSDGL